MNETIIFENVLSILNQLGLKAVVQKRDPAIGKARPDALIRLKRGKPALDYVAEIKRTLTPATLGAVVTQMRQYAEITERIPLLITDYVTPPIAERLKALGLHFVDAVGNAYLEGPDFLIWVAGRQREKQTLNTAAGNMFTPASLKVLFALICEPELADRPYREIAAAANVALGAVTPALNGLRTQGHLAVAKNKRRLIGAKRLLDDWALAYARTLWPKLLLRTFATPEFDNWRQWDLTKDKAQWGGEPAAALLTRYLKPGVLTLYADKLPARLVVTQRLTVAEPHMTMRVVEIRKRFWGANFPNNIDPAAVPPALIYADLLATGEARCIETAQLIYDQYLARLFPQA